MENKIIDLGDKTQEKILAGVTKAAGAIKTTLGPAGRCVAITNPMGVEVTRDGSTVAKSIKLKDSQENIGADLIKRAAENTERQAGDGTSTTSVLIEELCKRGQRAIASGANIYEVKSGMETALEYVKGYIAGVSDKVDGDLEKIRKVATISANNDPEIGGMIVDIMTQIGTDATITADMSSGIDTVIEVVKGMKIDRGWASPAFITDQKAGESVLQEPYVLVAGETISSVNQLIPLFESLAKASDTSPFLLVVDDMADNVLQMLAFNVMSGRCSCCVVKGVDYGDGRKNIMQDIATMTGATYFSTETGHNLSTLTLADLGKANKIVVSRDATIITEGYGDAEHIRQRAELIKARLDDPKTSDYDRHKFLSRYSNLAGGIGVIKAGGASQVEKENKKATIDDAILASKSAIAEGVVPGSGYVFLQASIAGKKDTGLFKPLTEDEKVGAMIVFDSLPVIMRTIAENAGLSGDVILEKVGNHNDKKGPWGLNAKTKKFGNLVDFGILDSAKVLRVSLENSVSTASMILLIDCTVIPEPVKECNCGNGDIVETGEF